MCHPVEVKASEYVDVTGHTQSLTGWAQHTCGEVPEGFSGPFPAAT